MRIAVFGAGAVGGYFGARLAAVGEDVVFLARGANLDVLRRSGLTVESPKGNLRLPHVAATDRPEGVGPVDVVLFAVKLYDMAAAASTLRPLMGPDSVVVTIQNGVEAVAALAQHVGPEHVAGGAAYIVAALDAPGRIRHSASDRLIFGETDGSRSARLAAFQAALTRAGADAALSECIELELWTKFVRLTAWSGLTAVTRCPMGVLRDDPELSALLQAALREGIAVARARGVPLPDSLVEDSQALARTFPYEAKSSMLEDLEHGRRLELPWLSGAVVRLGSEAGIPTPVHRFIAATLGPFVGGRPA